MTRNNNDYNWKLLELETFDKPSSIRIFVSNKANIDLRSHLVSNKTNVQDMCLRGLNKQKHDPTRRVPLASR